MSRYDVFISYRRDGGAETARLLRMALIQQGYRVFLDVDDLSSGHFDERLIDCIAETPHFIIILSPRALDRVNDPEDWVRQELQQAMRCECNLVPLLMPGFEYPDDDGLPASLRGLQRHNAVTYSHQYFDATVQRLVQHLRQEAVARTEAGPDDINQRGAGAVSDPVDADAYGAFTAVPATPYIIFGLLSGWAYVAWGIGGALVEHLGGRRRHFEQLVRSGDLAQAPDQDAAFETLAQRAFDVGNRWPGWLAFGLLLAMLYTVGLFFYFMAVRASPLLTTLPVMLLAVASVLFYLLILTFVSWFRSTLKRHDRYERLLFRWLSDPRVNVRTLPEREFSQRWEALDQQVALFLIVGLPVMLSPAVGGWIVLVAQAVPLGSTLMPLWILVIAGGYHLWGVWLLRRLFHVHLAAEQAKLGSAP